MDQFPWEGNFYILFVLCLNKMCIQLRYIVYIKQAIWLIILYFFFWNGKLAAILFLANKIENSLRDTLLHISWLIYDFIWFLCDALHFTTFKTNIIYIIPVVKAKILQRKETGGSIFENVVYTVKVTTVYKVKLFRLNLTVGIILSVRL